MSYSELQITSNFSFLLGASHPEELVEHAIELGYHKIAITDRNTVAGVVRAHMAVANLNKQLRERDEPEIAFTTIPACRLDLADGPSLLAYPTDITAWGRLCALLSKGNLRTEKGKCQLYQADVFEHQQGIIFVIIPPGELNEDFDFDDDFKRALKVYQANIHQPLYIAASRTYNGDDAKRLYRLNATGIPMVATNDVHYHNAERRELQDVETCVKEKCTINTAGFKLHANAERYLKPVEELQRLFAHYPEAIERTREIADACTFSLDTLQYLEPEFISRDGRSADEHLAAYTWAGAERLFKGNVPQKIRDQIAYELAFFAKRKLAPYFLRIYEYTKKAEELKILFQGRGSAANSTVCFCLGITPVNPDKTTLLFSRFMSDARDEWPDVDVDFEHERREEIIQWIFEEYGREHAAIVATVTELRHKGAIRDVGKAMGLSIDTIKRLSGAIRDFSEDAFDEERITEQGLNPKEPLLHKTLQLTEQLRGFPRQLGQHSGGFVITRCKLADICPVMNARMEGRTQLEWNKDDLEDLKILKVDVLALGMLTCIRKGFDMIKQHYGAELTLENVPQDDARVYDMICKADTLGVFQIESRAQMSMLPRLKPRVFYDLVIEVAIVRPGPIQGDMVHPYLRRREGKEKEEYPKEELRPILSRTKGVPLFQEQAMQIAITAADFTHAEADQLRRSMASFKSHGMVTKFREKLVSGMMKKGYEEDFAQRIFKQLEGFGSYGFPESHAAAFAHLVYISSWLKCFCPDVFAASLLNSQPMGFYQPAEIVDDARNHGVNVLPVDINHSQWNHTLEAPLNGQAPDMALKNYCSLRLGFRLVKGLRPDDMELLIANAPYQTIAQMTATGIPQPALQKLADADAFRSIGLDRRQALWEIAALADVPIAIFKDQPSETQLEGQISLPFMAPSEHVVEDIASTSLSLKAHPVSFLRYELNQLKVTPTGHIAEMQDGTPVKLAGMITVRQRPGTAKGVLFITIKDETSFANLVVWQKVFDQYKREILQAKLLMVEGKLQKEGDVIHVVVHKCYNMNNMLSQLTARQHEFPAVQQSPGNETVTSPQKREHPVTEVFYKGRNFQ
ncbi:error-prone DNA polymerase [Mucilaginibacter yixingensis]|uniref:DNA polymerase III subunit alpha n=1 Tax=Mucilaginibacter yixingensis TaxID=1295612 RepID=A0A2T5JGV3_9SPHI|nr:error-prone DNA polymerase [Mucilaginibacter yixingensis]PTR01660.1 error-prone DNA polymerase [Mucilaginibacter yixingensis]